MSPHIVRFKQYLMYEKGLSPKSVEAYLHDVLLLEDFLGNTPIENATFEDLQQFLKHLYKADYNARSQARIISGMRAFYRYLIYANVREDDPTELLDAPKIGMHLPDVLTVEEIQNIMDIGCHAVGRLVAFQDQIPTETVNDRFHRISFSISIRSMLRAARAARSMIC